jgi:hypothetical protein
MVGILEPGEKLPAWATPARVAHIRANVGVDATLLGNDIGLCAQYVEIIQRRLGLRKCRNYQTKEERNGRPSGGVRA